MLCSSNAERPAPCEGGPMRRGVESRSLNVAFDFFEHVVRNRRIRELRILPVCVIFEPPIDNLAVEVDPGVAAFDVDSVIVHVNAILEFSSLDDDVERPA